MKIPFVLKRFLFTLDRTTLLACLVIPIIQYGLARIAMYLSFTNGASAIWPTAGFYLTAVLILGWRIWPALLVAELIGNTLFYQNPIALVSISFVDLIDPLLIGFFIRRWIGHYQFLNRSQDLFKFLGIVFGVPLISATLATGLLCGLGIAPWSSVVETWRIWYMSIISGVSIVAPMLLSWVHPANWRRRQSRLAREFALPMAITIAISYISFWQEYGLEYMTIPLLMWCGFRFGHRESTLLVFVIDSIAIVATRQGFGPFVRSDVSQSLVLLQSFILVVALTGYILCAVVNENRQAALNLKKVNDELEQRVAERTTELEVAKDKAEIANQAKSAFIANMSHELRSPLNAILGFAQIMRSSQTLSPENQESVSIINRSGEHLLTLINNVLDLSKIEAGRVTLNEKNFDLHRLLDDIHDMFQLKAADKGLQLLLEPADNLPRYIRTDEVKLRQILINLINNALKFTELGGICIRSQRIDASKIAFEVEDTGPGIAPEDLDKLFEAFSQTESGKQSQEGTGLGLSISRKFVQLMGGEIRVSSQVGQGTIFGFEISVWEVEATEVESQQVNKRRIIGLEADQPPYRILIVDDKLVNRQLLVKLLSPFGFELGEASNGKEAVDISVQWRPHLIWMDMRMPVMDGFEATQRIKATTPGQGTAIIALTASVLEEERAVVLSAGCDDFLRKPFREEDIFQMMEKHLGLRYVYEDSSPKLETPHRTDVLSSENIQALSPELLAQLRRAVVSASKRDMAKTVEAIGAQNAPLAEAIAQCLYNFEYDKILNLMPQEDS